MQVKKKTFRGPDPEMMPRSKKRPKPESTGAAMARMAPVLARTRAARAELDAVIAEQPPVPPLTQAELDAIAPLGSPPVTAEAFYGPMLRLVGRGRGRGSAELAEETEDGHPAPNPGSPLMSYDPDYNAPARTIEVSPDLWDRFQRYLALVGGDPTAVADNIIDQALPPIDPTPVTHAMYEGRIVQRTTVRCACCGGACRHPFNWRGIVRCGCQSLASGKPSQGS